MTNRAETSSPTASRFLATGDMACPPELLELAASSAPKTIWICARHWPSNIGNSTRCRGGKIGSANPYW